MPSRKTKYGPEQVNASSLIGLFNAWHLHACEHGEVEVSGFQAYEGSNTSGEGIHSEDGFVHACREDPPRIYLSARTPDRSYEITIDHLRGAGTQVTVRTPSSSSLNDVLRTLELVAGHSASNPRLDSSTATAIRRSAGLSVIDNYTGLSSQSPSADSIVIAKLQWPSLDDEGFERLLFNVAANAPGYDNPQWLMHTNAPDRSRDISVNRVITDSLSGLSKQRVIIQAKHWQAKSVRPEDISAAVTQMALWEPPLVSVLVMASSGRFTSDAVAWVERHNELGKRPIVEMWPESTLELILARMPSLVDAYNLKPLRLSCATWRYQVDGRCGRDRLVTLRTFEETN